MPQIIILEKPKHIFIIVADSLRKDAVYNQGVGMDYVEKNSIQFTQARSSACWTLPATSCMFTGLNVHEHQTDTHTRNLPKNISTLSEHMKAKGYKTIQVTANPVTTEIFGLNRGFDQVFKTWKLVTPKLKKTMYFLLSMSKHRVRNMIFSKDVVSQKLLEDIEVANCWGQNTHLDAFQKVNELIEENDKIGQPCFFFINLMETHFPYHIADTFKLSGNSLLEKINEVTTLFKIANQNFLLQENPSIDQKYADLIYKRQLTSYQIIKNDLNYFIESIHKNKENLVVFCSDHGDNFGEMNWYYHFSNVNDGGNRVPLFWLNPNGDGAKVVDTPISSRFIFQSLLEHIGVPQDTTLFKNEALNFPTIQSFWYKHQRGTIEKYKYNQFLFIDNGNRFVKRNDVWLTAPITGDSYHDESRFVKMDHKTNPIEEFVEDQEKQKYLLNREEEFDVFSNKMMEATKS